jgi:pentatricopeptide repeat protein
MKGDGLAADQYTCNALIDALCKNGKIDEACSFFDDLEDRGIRPNSVTFNTLIYGLCKAGKVDAAQMFLEKMISAGFSPDTYTYSPFIENLCKTKGSGEGLSFIDEMLQKDVKPSTVNYTIVIDKLFKERNYELATRMWGQMVSLGCSPDVVTYTTSVRAYCNEGRLDEAENVVMDMDRSGVNIDAMAYNTLMDGYASVGQTDRAITILKHMTSVASMPNHFTFLILLRNLIKRRRAEHVPLKASRVWTTIELADIFELFELMKKNGVPSSARAYLTILEGFSEDRRLDEVTSLVSRMKEDNLPLNEDICTALVNCFCKLRMYTDAWALLCSMIGRGFLPNLLSYQHLLSGLTAEGQEDRAKEIFRDSRWKDYNPDEIVWKVIIDGLIRKGHSEMCHDMISTLEQMNCKLSDQTYAMLTEELSTRE